MEKAMKNGSKVRTAANKSQVEPRERSFAESLLAGDAVSPTTFLGERVTAAFERYRSNTAAARKRTA